jgi:hypothetical protein
MVPHNVHPKESEARPVLRVALALLFAFMVVTLLSDALPLLATPGAVQISCHSRKLMCEIGAALVNLFPSPAQRTVLGITGLAAALGTGLIGVVCWRAMRRSGKSDRAA